jgi:hypothetical protein
LSNSLDYATLDQGDEATLNQLIQEQLGRGVARRSRPVTTVKTDATPQLPPGMLGSGQLLASQLLAIARKCRGDQECWRSELLKKATAKPG